MKRITTDKMIGRLLRGEEAIAEGEFISTDKQFMAITSCGCSISVNTPDRMNMETGECRLCESERIQEEKEEAEELAALELDDEEAA